MKKRNKITEEENVNETTEVNEVESEEPKKKGIRKTVFYIFYEVFGVFCLVLFILTLFDSPRNFILDKFNMFIGLVVMIYGVVFLLPYTFKKKELQRARMASMTLRTPNEKGQYNVNKYEKVY